jgi:hypothetical protein
MSGEAREEGFYWVILGNNPPEIAYWERGEWWLAGDEHPWQPDAVTVASARLTTSRVWCHERHHTAAALEQNRRDRRARQDAGGHLPQLHAVRTLEHGAPAR